jgi:hypothetical protein
MAVIGRLDEQVDAVLISPLGKRRDEPEHTPEPDREETNTLGDEESSGPQSRERAEELPVWLL